MVRQMVKIDDVQKDGGIVAGGWVFSYFSHQFSPEFESSCRGDFSGAQSFCCPLSAVQVFPDRHIGPPEQVE